MNVTWGKYPHQHRPHRFPRLLPLPRWQPHRQERQRHHPGLQRLPQPAGGGRSQSQGAHRPGHHRNESGGGAPVTQPLASKASGPAAHPLFERKSGFLQRPPAAIERNRVRVAHLLQIVRHQRGAESAAAIEHQRGRSCPGTFVSISRSMMPLLMCTAPATWPAAHSLSSRVSTRTCGSPARHHLLVALDIDLLHARFRVVHQLQESGTVRPSPISLHPFDLGARAAPASPRFSRSRGRCDTRGRSPSRPCATSAASTSDALARRSDAITPAPVSAPRPGHHRLPAVEPDIGAHAHQFLRVHEAVLENRLHDRWRCPRPASSAPCTAPADRWRIRDIPRWSYPPSAACRRARTRSVSASGLRHIHAGLLQLAPPARPDAPECSPSPSGRRR